MPKVPNTPVHLPFLENACTLFEDFTEFSSVSTTGRWTSAATNGTNAIVSSSSTGPGAVGGVLELVPSNATPAANDYAAISGTNAVWQLVADQPILFECSAMWTENNTNYANVAFGLASGTVSSLLGNGSGGPAANFYGALIYKTGASSGTGSYKTISSLGTTQITNTSKNSTTAAQSDFQKIGIKISPVYGGTAQQTAQTLTVEYFVNDQPLLQNITALSGYAPIKDTTTFTSPITTYVYPVVMVKNGATVSGGMENCFIDWISVVQKRTPNTNSPD